MAKLTLKISSLVDDLLSSIIAHNTNSLTLGRFLSPLAAVPLVSLAGFGLYELGFPGVRVIMLEITVMKFLIMAPKHVLMLVNFHPLIGGKMC